MSFWTSSTPVIGQGRGKALFVDVEVLVLAQASHHFVERPILLAGGLRRPADNQRPYGIHR